MAASAATLQDNRPVYSMPNYGNTLVFLKIMFTVKARQLLIMTLYYGKTISLQFWISLDIVYHVRWCQIWQTHFLKLLNFEEVSRPECLVGDLCRNQLWVQGSDMGTAHKDGGDVRLTGLDIKLGLPLFKCLIWRRIANVVHTILFNTVVILLSGWRIFASRLIF